MFDNVSFADNPPNKQFTVYMFWTLHGLRVARAVKVTAYSMSHARKVAGDELPTAEIVGVQLCKPE